MFDKTEIIRDLKGISKARAKACGLIFEEVTELPGQYVCKCSTGRVLYQGSLGATHTFLDGYHCAFSELQR